MVRKIIIDTDPGVDDSMAILFALHSPEVEVLGLTTIYGNVQVDLAAQNGLRLVEFMGRSDIPVAQGAALPLIASFDSPADFVHGKDGLGNRNLPPPQGKLIDIPAAQFIVETVMKHPGEVTLITLGPLTNIALAIALEPRIVEQVAEVVVMGGAITINGNVTPSSEANIIHDPHAADLVFNAGWPVSMVGLDVTTQVIMDDDYLWSLKESGTKTCHFIYGISRFYRDYHEKTYQLAGMYTHDPSAVAYVIDPTLFTTEQGPIRVVTEGIALGQTVMDRYQNWDRENPWTGRRPVRVCLGVDPERLLSFYKKQITQPD